ncbi:DUF397 domain-containing protein [Streptomyces sp. NPDC046853]|uniref:DUF397 domain-containing protein n=1 Tax=Streptomyces sp. NPDC046853 TaxID=3154920 RepID=UPI0033F65DC5
MATATTWQKSSFSGGGDGANCVELRAQHPGTVKLRESDAPSTELSTTPERLAHLIRHVKTQSRIHPCE